MPTPPENRIFSTKYFVQPGIGIGIAAANSIGYRAPARYWSNPCHKTLTDLATTNGDKYTV